MNLTPAGAADLEAVAALVNRAYRADGGWTNERGHVEGDRTSAAALAADLAANPAAQLLLWREDDALLGCVWLEPAGPQTWYLGLLTVRPDQQDRKLGRALLEAAEAHAARAGARRIRMTVVNVRDTLIAWYRRRGYDLTGEVEPFPYADQRFGVPLRDDLAFVVLQRNLE